MKPITFEDLETLARTCWGEARGEPMEGKIAVAAVILNRWRSGRWFAGRTIAETCTKPYQFSCWLESDPNRTKLLAVDLRDRMFRECVAAALQAIGGEDPTDGSTHYHALHVRPAWARDKTPTRVIAHHLFYRGID